VDVSGKNEIRVTICTVLLCLLFTLPAFTRNNFCSDDYRYSCPSMSDEAFKKEMGYKEPVMRPTLLQSVGRRLVVCCGEVNHLLISF